MKPITIIIPGEPVPLARARVGPRGGKTPPKSAAAKERIAYLTKQELSRYPEEFPLFAEFGVVVRFYEGVRPWEHQCDLDNCVKLLNDALNGIVWADDRLVAFTESRIFRGCRNPRTEFVITLHKQKGKELA